MVVRGWICGTVSKFIVLLYIVHGGFGHFCVRWSEFSDLQSSVGKATVYFPQGSTALACLEVNGRERVKDRKVERVGKTGRLKKAIEALRER